MIRCSTVAKTARSTGNWKLRPERRSSITARQPVSSHRRPNSRGAPMRLQASRSGFAGLELRQNHGPLGVAGNRAGQALKGPGRREDLLAAQVLDDALLGAAVLTHGLDEVEVGVAVDALLADEHDQLAAPHDAACQRKSTFTLQ